MQIKSNVGKGKTTNQYEVVNALKQQTEIKIQRITIPEKFPILKRLLLIAGQICTK